MEKINTQQGFIQIPILAALVVFGMIAAGGGYYAIHRGQEEDKEEDKLEAGETLIQSNSGSNFVAEEFIKVDFSEQDSNKIDFKPTIKPPLSFQEKIKPVNDKLTDKLKKEDVADFQSFIVEAEEQVKFLEQDKDDFQFLREAIDDHYEKSIEHAKASLNDWANLAEKNAASAPTEYKQILLLTRDSIISDKEYVVQYVKSLYEIMNLYFLNSDLKQDVRHIISGDQKLLNNCVEMWKNSKKDSVCDSLLGLVKSNRKNYASDFIKIAERLVEIDNLALETIGNHAEKAEDIIMSDLDRISRSINNASAFQAEMDRISQQARYSVSQPLKVYGAPAQTAEQKCDSQIAAWLANEGWRIPDSKPSC